MPRSYDQIVRLSESMAESLESDDTEPITSPEEATLRAATRRRSLAETDLGNAVATARRGGVPWQRIGEAGAPVARLLDRSTSTSAMRARTAPRRGGPRRSRSAQATMVDRRGSGPPPESLQSAFGRC